MNKKIKKLLKEATNLLLKKVIRDIKSKEQKETKYKLVNGKLFGAYLVKTKSKKCLTCRGLGTHETDWIMSQKCRDCKGTGRLNI